MTAAFTAAAAVAHFADATPLLTFGLATVALAGLAWIVSFSTERVGQHYGPAVTGVLQSTLGNLPEFFIVLFALSAGELVVAKTSILGSIFANALLVLGIVIVAGCHASADGVMHFQTRLPKDNAVLVAAHELPDRADRAVRGDRGQRFAPHRGDLDRRRDRPAAHLRRLAERLPPLGHARRGRRSGACASR